jgi:hypothetical protein
MKEIYKEVPQLQTVPFSCDRCHVMMFRNEKRTAIHSGTPYVTNEGKKSYTDVEIEYVCANCKPVGEIPREQNKVLTTPPRMPGG